MKYYYFEDDTTGEPFVVGADSQKEAVFYALDYFSEPVFYWEVSEEWVDGCGFDVY